MNEHADAYATLTERIAEHEAQLVHPVDFSGREICLVMLELDDARALRDLIDALRRAGQAMYSCCPEPVCGGREAWDRAVLTALTAPSGGDDE